MTTTQIIGIGNTDRGDDAAGPAVVAALESRSLHEVTLRCARGDVLALIDDWGGAERVFLIDAMAPDGAPGRVLRLDAGTSAVSPTFANFASSHAFNLAEAIELARALDRLPRELIVYGIEGLSFSHGAALSAAVAAAVPEVARRIMEELKMEALSVCTKPH